MPTAARTTADRWPARLDGLQSLSGLLLALFMIGHMLFVSSILLGHEAMWTVARAFEGQFLFGRPYPALVSAVVAGVILLLALHALLALRKFPADWRQYGAIHAAAGDLRHDDTRLWLWQVYTGFAMFFLAAPHLYVMLTRPDLIGPYESADRVWTGLFWPLYLLLLLAVELHGGIGLYRLAMKWGWLEGRDPRATRARLKRAKWAMTAAFLALGLATLAAYVRLGIEHAPRAGERYLPPAAAEAPR